MQAPRILRVSEFQIKKLNSHNKFPPAADAGGFRVGVRRLKESRDGLEILRLRLVAPRMTDEAASS